MKQILNKLISESKDVHYLDMAECAQPLRCVNKPALTSRSYDRKSLKTPTSKA